MAQGKKRILLTLATGTGKTCIAFQIVWKLDYIHYNSMKHYNIAPKDWEYSSFRKFVKNGFYNLDWCNFNDNHRINELNYE